ncbi:MAG TPA: ADP-ribosylglycohydrolase family protein [Anaerolineaceae bacterium]|nr:ADP-ribosylglycohydrolase family protein [Anaerolineaceae bacterium]
MIGAIIGDIVGSRFEFANHRHYDGFDLFAQLCDFTDDTVLTVATAKVLLDGGSYTEAYRDFARRYPFRGYGGRFSRWIANEHMGPYNSFGNGSAMRVSPVGFAFGDLEMTLAEAKRSAEVTHNHPEGIKGAQALAQAIFMARQGESKEGIRQAIAASFGYDFSRSIEQIRRVNRFDETCQGSLPEALTCFFESRDFEDCLRLSVSIGGDTDTIACMAGGLAQAYYKAIPSWIVEEARAFLPEEFKEILGRFELTYPDAAV